MFLKISWGTVARLPSAVVGLTYTVARHPSITITLFPAPAMKHVQKYVFRKNLCLMLAFLGTPDMITVLLFSVSWQTVYYENVNAILSLSPTYYYYYQGRIYA